MNEVARRGSSIARIPTIPWLAFEQFKDTLVDNNCAWIDGARFNSLRLERVCVSQELFLQHPIHPGRTQCRRKTKQGGTTDHLLHTSQPFLSKSRWRSTQWGLHNSQVSALSQQLETWSRRRLLGKTVLNTRSRIAILAGEIKCNNRTQSCAARLHLLSDFSERRSNTIRKTLNPSTCAEWDT